MTEGVGGSENILEDVERGKVNAEPLSDDTAQWASCLPTEMYGKIGLAPDECSGGFFAGSNPDSLVEVVTCCPWPLLLFWMGFCRFELCHQDMNSLIQENIHTEVIMQA